MQAQNTLELYKRQQQQQHSDNNHRMVAAKKDVTDITDYINFAKSRAMQLNKVALDAIRQQLAEAEAVMAESQAAWTLSKRKLAAVQAL